MVAEPNILQTILVPLLIAIIGGAISVGTAIMGYLIKDKLQGMEDKREQDIARRKREHQIVIDWLASLTEAVNKDKEVEIPEEIDYSVKFDEGTDD